MKEIESNVDVYTKDIKDFGEKILIYGKWSNLIYSIDEENYPEFASLLLSKSKSNAMEFPKDGEFREIESRTGILVDAAERLVSLGRDDMAEEAALAAADAIEMVPYAHASRARVVRALALVGRMRRAEDITAKAVGEDERLRCNAALLSGHVLRKDVKLQHKVLASEHKEWEAASF